MAINFPDASETPFFDANGQEWQHNGDAWIRIYEDAAIAGEDYVSGIKSIILNGHFNIWQRYNGTVKAGSGYNADRWFTLDQENNSVNTSRVGVSVSEGKDMYYPNGSCLVNIGTLGSSANEAVSLWQHIYDVRYFAGEVVTLSFWAKTGSGSGFKIATEISQHFGDGGSATVANLLTKAHTISGEWTLYTVTGTIPHINDKVIGTQSSLRVIFWLSAGSNWNSRASGIGHQKFGAQITNVQLEPGENATKMDIFDWDAEITSCQRFFCKSYNISTPVGSVNDGEGAITHMQVTTDSILWGTSVQFPTSMRKAPNVVLYSLATGVPNRVNIAGGADIPATAPLVGQSGIDYVQTTGTVDANIPIVFHYSADADFY